jgi:hypothetical protein
VLVAGCEERGLGEGQEGPAEEDAAGGHGEAWLLVLVLVLGRVLDLRSGGVPNGSRGVARPEDYRRATLRDAVETMTLRDSGDGRDTSQAGTPGAGTESPECRLDVVIPMMAHKKGADASVTAGYAEGLEA